MTGMIDQTYAKPHLRWKGRDFRIPADEAFIVSVYFSLYEVCILNGCYDSRRKKVVF